MTAAIATHVDYTVPASPQQIAKTAAAVKARGIHVEIVETAADALQKINELIPAGATVMTGASQSLQHIGLEQQLIDKDHPWVNLKDAIQEETDPAKQHALRVQSILSPYFLGSVHAIAETGEIVIASASGSQVSPYAFSSQNVIWVVGVQKIVPTLEDALRRIREYCLPKENERAQAAYGMNSVIAKILIVEQEPPMMQRNITLILVKETVGV